MGSRRFLSGCRVKSPRRGGIFVWGGSSELLDVVPKSCFTVVCLVLGLRL